MRYRRRGKAYMHAHPSLDDEVRANMKEALGGRSLAWARRNKEAAFDMLERYQFSKGQADFVADSLYVYTYNHNYSHASNIADDIILQNVSSISSKRMLILFHTFLKPRCSLSTTIRTDPPLRDPPYTHAWILCIIYLYMCIITHARTRAHAYHHPTILTLYYPAVFFNNLSQRIQI